MPALAIGGTLVRLTSTFVVADEDAPPSLSVTVSLKVRVELDVVDVGALNVALAVLAPCSVTVGPAVCTH